MNTDCPAASGALRPNPSHAVVMAWDSATTPRKSATFCGTVKSRAAGTTQNSAKDPCRLSYPNEFDQTRSPTLNPVTDSPTASTVPATSRPMMNGEGSSVAYAPERTKVSTWFTQENSARTNTSSGCGLGIGTSRTAMDSAGPGTSITAARIMFPACSRGRRQAKYGGKCARWAGNVDSSQNTAAPGGCPPTPVR